MDRTAQRDRARAFMVKLAALAQEHEVTINSCGCCDGVWATFKDGEKREFCVQRVFVHDGAAYGSFDFDDDDQLAVNAAGEEVAE